MPVVSGRPVRQRSPAWVAQQKPELCGSHAFATLETLTVLKESAKARTKVMTWNALRIDIGWASQPHRRFS
jgi:hypothetical protein